MRQKSIKCCLKQAISVIVSFTIQHTELDVSSNPVGKIETIDHYDRVQKGKAGYIVVTSNTSPNIVHKLNCPRVHVRYFKIHVIDNSGKDGNYYWVSNLGYAKNVFNALQCMDCLRHI
jgi:hypothetical protein